MGWILLLVASVFEFSWTITMKAASGFDKPLMLAASVILMIFSFVFLLLSSRHLPVIYCYPVWTGIGTVGTVILGHYLLKERVDLSGLFCIGLIVIGTVGLYLLTPE